LERRKAAFGQPFFVRGSLNTPSGARQILNAGLVPSLQVSAGRKQSVYEKQKPVLKLISCPIDPRFMMALQERGNVFGTIQAEAWAPSPATPELEEFF
jgi:hypothetical protein